MAVALFLVAVLALAGGASHLDEPQQLVVRLAAIAVIAASLWPLDFAPFRRNRNVVAFAVLTLGLLLLHLVPLPPGLWASLPGHSTYARIAEVSGTAGWRPLSLTPDRTENAALALLAPFAAGIVTLYLDRSNRLRLFHWLVAVACISALLGLLQLSAGSGAFRLFQRTDSNAPVGLFANQNHQAAMLACVLPFTGALAAIRLRERGHREAILVVLFAGVALLLAMLVSTGSRMGLALGLVGLAGAVWCWRAGGQPLLPTARRERIALGVCMMLTALATGVAAIGGGAINRLVESRFATETRAESLAPLLETAWAFMPLGAGFGAFENVYPQFEPDSLLSTIYLNAAHNEPLQLAIEGGLPALVLLALFGWWWLRTALRIIWSNGSSRGRVTGLAAVAATFMVMASSLVDYPLRTPLLGALFAVGCIEMALTARQSESRKAGR